MAIDERYLNFLQFATRGMVPNRLPMQQVRDVPPYAVLPQPVPMASEVRSAAPIAPTFQPMVVERTMPQLPMLTSVPQRAVAPATDYSRPEFQLPNIPERPTMPQMPMRDFGQEQRVTSRNTLRATLLGALLGGGAGALGAMTGAQQGARQAFDQDYAQRMAQFQNEQQMALQQKQIADQEYNQRIAAVNALIGRADAQRAANQQLLDVDYSNQVAQYNAQIAANELARKTADERGQRILDLMGNIPKVSKEDQARFIQFGLTGDAKFAEGGFRPAGAEQPISPYISAIRNAQTTWLKQREVPMDPAVYAADANQWNQSIDADTSIPENVKAFLKVPTVQQRTLGVARLGETKRGAQAREQGAAESRTETKRHNLAMEGIRRDAVAVSRISANAAAKRAAGKPATYTKESNKTIIDGFNKIRDEVAQMERALAKPGAQIDAIGGGYRARLEELRAQLKTYPAQFPEYEFSGLDSGVPTIRPKKGAVVSPASPNPPAGAKNTGEFQEFTIDGQKVRVRVR